MLLLASLDTAEGCNHPRAQVLLLASLDTAEGCNHPCAQVLLLASLDTALGEEEVATGFNQERDIRSKSVTLAGPISRLFAGL